MQLLYSRLRLKRLYSLVPDVAQPFLRQNLSLCAGTQISKLEPSLDGEGTPNHSAYLKFNY